MGAKQLKSKVKKITARIEQDLISTRRHLHMHPELSFEEENTSAFIKEKLRSLGISYTEGWAEYGIVASIKGRQKSRKRIALRADIDALPILEQTNKPYASKIKGKMHACGHDVHTTCVLGVAQILKETTEDWGGTVQLIFQPGEEKLPGGASIMIKEGAFGKRLPSSILGQHVHPPLEVGKVGFRSGQYMASADEIYITIKGKGGHAALPRDFIDPIYTASQLISQLQSVISRSSDPLVPAVLSFGKIYSDGGATNVIPEKVFIEGTLRTMDEGNRFHLHERIKKISKSVGQSMSAKINARIEVGYPSLFNDERLTTRSIAIAQDYLGNQNVVHLPMRMTAEDFSFYSQNMPACFYRLGTGNVTKGITASVHHPKFDIDEAAIGIGAGLMAYQAIEHLSN